MCGLRSSSPLRQRSKAGALFAGVNKRGNGALGSRLKWVMRQVCAEASNESFTGNVGFYEQKTDEEEDKKEGDQLRASKKNYFFMKRKESWWAAAVMETPEKIGQCLTQREDGIRIHKNNPSASAAPAAYEPRWIYWGGCWRCDRFAPLNRAVVLKAYKRSYTLLRFYTSKEKQNRYFCFYNWVNKYPEQWVKSVFIIGHTQNILEL